MNAYKEGEWLPSWASPGYRNCMVGTFADVVISDAIAKNIPGFELNTARDALLKDVCICTHTHSHMTSAVNIVLYV